MVMVIILVMVMVMMMMVMVMVVIPPKEQGKVPVVPALIVMMVMVRVRVSRQRKKGGRMIITPMLVLVLVRVLIHRRKKIETDKMRSCTATRAPQTSSYAPSQPLLVGVRKGESQVPLSPRRKTGGLYARSSQAWS